MGSIERHNKDRCRRCGATDHVFWTCNGEPHPGSQYKFQPKGLEETYEYEVNIKTTDKSTINDIHNDNASLKEGNDMYMRVQNNLEKLIEDKLEDIYFSVGTISETVNLHSEYIRKVKAKNEALDTDQITEKVQDSKEDLQQYDHTDEQVAIEKDQDTIKYMEDLEYLL